MEFNTYGILFPEYNRHDAFGPIGNEKKNLCGHVVIFQNIGDVYKQFIARPFIQKHNIELNL
jgi:hypothetical protein